MVFSFIEWISTSQKFVECVIQIKPATDQFTCDRVVVDSPRNFVASRRVLVERKPLCRVQATPSIAEIPKISLSGIQYLSLEAYQLITKGSAPSLRRNRHTSSRPAYEATWYSQQTSVRSYIRNALTCNNDIESLFRSVGAANRAWNRY